MARKKAMPLIEDFNNIPKEALIPEREQPYPIPEHWRWVRLGSVTAPMKTRKPSGNSFNYIDIESIDNSDQTVKAAKIVTTPNAPSRASRAVHVGDTLFSMVRPYLRNIALIDENLSHAIASTGFYICTPIKGVLVPQFLFEFLRSKFFIGQITSKMKGDNSPSVKNSDMLNAATPLPPLDEQERIVAYLDENLGKIDNVCGKLQDFLAGAEERKERLIQAGVSGHLTEDWREKHEMSLDDWVPKKLADLGAVVTGGTPSTKHPELYGDQLPFVKPTDLNAGRHVITSQTYLSNLGTESVRMLPANTVAVCCIGATIGKCGLIEVPSATNQQINSLVPNNDNDAIFLYYLAESPTFKSAIIENSSSTTLPILNKSRFSKLCVTVPTKPEQEKIARILDSTLQLAQQAHDKVRITLAQLDSAKQQLVSAALSGRLT